MLNEFAVQFWKVSEESRGETKRRVRLSTNYVITSICQFRIQEREENRLLKLFVLRAIFSDHFCLNMAQLHVGAKRPPKCFMKAIFAWFIYFWTKFGRWAFLVLQFILIWKLWQNGRLWRHNWWRHQNVLQFFVKSDVKIMPLERPWLEE